ncbi:MAG: hypothetical protein ACXVCY_11855 [Pseudobdellovibrionaceae bacterium]
MNLLQLMLGIGLSVAIESAIALVSINQMKLQHEVEFRESLMGIKNSLQEVIASDASWEVTKTMNNGMKCLTPGQPYCQQGGTQRLMIKLYDSMNNVIYDASNPTAGFTYHGTSCNSYSSSGNDACPLRVDLQWRGICNDTQCKSQEDFFTVEFKYSPKSKPIVFNAHNFNSAEQSRFNLGSKLSPVLDCASQGKLFIGKGKTLNSNSADGGGCVALSSMIGPKGYTGPKGFTGPMGPQGPMGPPGPSPSCPPPAAVSNL